MKRKMTPQDELNTNMRYRNEKKNTVNQIFSRKANGSKGSGINILDYTAGILIFFAGWYLFTFLLIKFDRNISVFPYPHKVLADFGYLLIHPIDGYTLIDHAWASFLRVLLGFLYAFMIAVPLGIVTGSNRILEKVFHPIIDILRPIPPIAWIPFAVIVFGLGAQSYSFIIFMGAFFPLFQNVYDGTKRLNPLYKEVALSLGAKRSDIIWEILLPGVSPNIVTGMKTSLGVGWMSVIAAEMMGLIGAGIGYFINYMKTIGLYSYMMAGMLMIGIVGLLLEASFKLLEKTLLKWM